MLPKWKRRGKIQHVRLKLTGDKQKSLQQEEELNLASFNCREPFPDFTVVKSWIKRCHRSGSCPLWHRRNCKCFHSHQNGCDLHPKWL